MPKTYNRKKIFVVALAISIVATLLSVRLGYLMVAKSEYYLEKAEDLHDRERSSKPY